MFRDVLIYPTHSTRSCVVSWRVDPSIKNAEFYIYKKPDGGAEWSLLNETPVFGTSFTDMEFVVRDKVQVPVYKILAILGTKEYESAEVAPFAYVTRKAFGVARTIIQLKYQQARQDGIPVLYYTLRRNGEKDATLDSVTGQKQSVACEEDMNTYYKHGYYPPFVTYIRFPEAHMYKNSSSQEGVFDTSVQNAEFLAHPPVRTSDLVIDVATDRRWIVGDTIKTDLLKGVIPVSYQAQLSQQNNNHPCFQVPIPGNYFAMVSQLTK